MFTQLLLIAFFGWLIFSNWGTVQMVSSSLFTAVTEGRDKIVALEARIASLEERSRNKQL